MAKEYTVADFYRKFLSDKILVKAVDEYFESRGIGIKPLEGIGKKAAEDMMEDIKKALDNLEKKI
jgi:Holliday junction resolvasome RuvABC DNA-binding subunit